MKDLEKTNNIPIETIDEANFLPMGWALKETQSKRPFSDDVKKFLDEKFEEGVTNGKKADPKIVEAEMKKAKVGNTKRFPINDRLTARQIASYFSRKASQQRHTSQIVTESQKVSCKNKKESIFRWLNKLIVKVYRWIIDMNLFFKMNSTIISNT